MAKSKEELRELKLYLSNNIKECIRFENRAAKNTRYSDAIELRGMTIAYQKIYNKVDKILLNFESQNKPTKTENNE